MPSLPYRVALISRGAGAFTYTYTGPPGLVRGQLAAIRFRQRLELGVVVDSDSAPPLEMALQRLWPVQCSVPDWGELLLDLCELACAAPDELAPRLALNGSANGLRLSLILAHADRISADLLTKLVQCSGPLTPTKRKLLTAVELGDSAVGLTEQGALELRLDFAGQPGINSVTPALRSLYRLSVAESSLLGLTGECREWWPGSYLAGLANPPKLVNLERRKASEPADKDSIDYAPQDPAWSAWDELTWPADWDIVQHWPRVAHLPLRRIQATWPELRTALPRLLAEAIAARERVLLFVPQIWLLDRLWPTFAPLAPSIARHDAANSPGTLAATLRLLESSGVNSESGCVVAGTAAAWRLAAYAHFDRCLLLDPTHPQWAPSSSPWLDPRAALLLALARRGTALDVIEFGLSSFDGRLPTAIQIHPPFDAGPQVPDSPTTLIDNNPLPLELRQPAIRKLVYFNRLGASRGLQCAECGTMIACPSCGSRTIFYSAHAQSFRCPHCGFNETQLRCPHCGLGTLAAHLPGLEAVRVRPGELLATHGEVRLGPEHGTVIGTAQLLEPIAGFWPEQIIYVDPDERDVLGTDWRTALDLPARLAALYANPDLRSVHAVSSRLATKTAGSLRTVDTAILARQEAQLRQLASLPPSGCLYHLRALASQLPPLAQLRIFLGEELSQHTGTSLLRLGQPFRRQRAELHGYLINPRLTWGELQELRWHAHRLGTSLSLQAQRGPWV